MQAEVAVVGAGIMGSAAAYALARQGRDVVLLEQFRVGHNHGSSHGRSRIVRLAYPEVEFVELAKEAMPGWRELERESGQELLEFQPRGRIESESYKFLGDMRSFNDTFESRIRAWVNDIQNKTPFDRVDAKAEDALAASALSPSAAQVK